MMRWRGSISLYVLVSIPFLAEIVRKYIVPSNLVLLFADALVIFVAFFLVITKPRSVTLVLAGAVILLSAWGLLTVVIGHQNVMLGLVGLRNFAVPSAYLLIGIAIWRALDPNASAASLYHAFSGWLIIIGSVALLQLLVGRDHWLNEIPDGIGDERGGIGDYTVDDLGNDYLFRPTSIFLHTGKFGSVVFVLAAYRVIYSLVSVRNSRQLARGILIDLLVLLISGQRAALVGYVLVAAAGLIAKARRPAMVAFWGMVVLVITVVGAAVLLSDLKPSGDIGPLFMMTARAASVLPDILFRLEDNVLRPAAYVFDRYAFSGAGLGVFSLGSGAFGGQPLYEVVPVGTAENSWLRMLAEQGLVGLILGMVFWVGLVVWSAVAWRTERRRTQSSRMQAAGDVLLLCPGIVLGVALLWANTHDFLGNTAVMSLCMLLFGMLAGEPIRWRYKNGHPR